MKKVYLKFLIVCIYTMIMSWVAFYFNKSLIGIDDANIYMIYMRNFAHGHGFVYNINSERVEGFTSLLWTLIGSCFYLVTDKPELIFLVLNIFLVSFTLWRVVLFVDEYTNDTGLITPATLLLLGLMTIIPGYFEWTILSYLETGLWSCLLVLISLNVLECRDNDLTSSNNIKFFMMIVLLTLCRPESTIWAPFFILLRFMKQYKTAGDNKKMLYLIFFFFTTFFVVQLSLIVWRIIYFGYPLPNTYYAKMGSDWIKNIKDGIRYLIYYTLDNPLIVFIMLITGWTVYLHVKQKHWVSNETSIFLIISIALFIPLYTGGDHFAYSRFIQPIVPLIWVLLILLAHTEKIFQRANSYSIIWGFLACVFFVPLHGIVNSLLNKSYPMKVEWDLAAEGRKNSELTMVFFDHQKVLPSQGVIPAGGIAYAYKGRTIDLMGLNNVMMAHGKKSTKKDLPKNHASFNKKIFYILNPDIVWMCKGFFDKDSLSANHQIVIHPFTADVLQNIYEDKLFKQTYFPVLIFKKQTSVCLSIVASGSFLKSLDKNFYSYRMLDQIRVMDH